MNDQQLATYLIFNNLRDEQNWREKALDLQVTKFEMQNSLTHMGKQCSELDGDKSYNYIDRSNKHVYNTKIKAELNRKKELE